MLLFTKLEKKGYFKAFESQITPLKTPDARHGAVGLLFLFSLGFGLFDQSFFAIFSHSSLLEWKPLLYVPVYWRYITWDFGYEENDG